MIPKNAVRALGAAAFVLVGFAPTVSAQLNNINYVATTQFQFGANNGTSAGANASVLAGNGFSNSATLGGLTLTAGGFNVTTNNNGYASVGGEGQNFGTASVAATAFDYGNSGQVAYMKVVFSAPTGSMTEIWRATLQGSSDGTGFGVGGFGLNWQIAGAFPSNNNFNSYSYGAIPGHPNGGTAYFNVSVNNINTSAAAFDQQISGSLQGQEFTDNPPPPTTTPEPASLVLMATGLLGVVGAARRRNRKR